MQLIFGAGEFYGVPLTDASGNNVSNPTPIRLGVLQGMSLDISADTKELFGQNQFAIDVARGKQKITGKVMYAQIAGRALNNLFFGQTLTSGTMQSVVADTTGAVVPGTPFTITPTVPNSGTFVQDLGVINAAGIPLVRVASAPSQGQYSVNQATGVYTFAASQTGETVFISYRYSYTLTSANNISLTNLAMGAVPTFQALMHASYKGRRALVNLSVAQFSKLALLSTKQDDHNIPEMEFNAYANAAGSVGNIYTEE